jgi:putative ABC transport system permease protein
VKRYIHDIHIAFEAILSNKLKSMLTALGIIFGVAAVISMLAIGNGARQEILEQIKMVGVNNIVISPVKTEKEEGAVSDDKEQDNKKEKKKYSPGLTINDVEAIKTILPNISNITPEINKNSYVLLNGHKQNATITGINNCYFQLFNLKLLEGSYFSNEQEEKGYAICIIGYNLKTKLFRNENPLNKFIKTDNKWLKVIGVLEKTTTRASEAGEKGAVTINDCVFVPTQTMLLRFQNRATVNSKSFNNNNNGSGKNTNQLDKIIVQINETEQLASSAEVINRMLTRRHNEVTDFKIVIPELLLKQQEKTKSIFNIVLGAIAAISLLVGGIGIMNIMFASVMERTREIGVRLAIGAKKKDIVIQFLAEAVMISVSGGIIGVILGFILTFLISKIAGIVTIVSFLSVFIAFIVSASVGIIFGYYPAKKASERDPIESLRYE